MITRIRKLIVLPAMVIAGLGLLAAFFLTDGSPTAESAGPYSVNGSVVRIDTVRQGPCQPGALYTGNSIAVSDNPTGADPIQLRFTAPINDSPGFRGCIAEYAYPKYLVIGNELFKYANVHTKTRDPVPITMTPPFNMYVDSCFGFAPSDLIYVGTERMQWDTGNCDGLEPEGTAQDDYLHITARPDATDHDHGPGSFVRVHGLLLLVGRGGIPKFLDFASSTFVPPPTSDTFAYTPKVAHSAGALAHSPATYATCIGYLKQTATGGDDPVTASTRCTLINEPGYDAAACDSTPSACYWPTSPPTDPAVLRRPVFPLLTAWNLTGTTMPPAYDELRGSIDDDGTGAVTFNYLQLNPTNNCQEFFYLSPSDHLYLSSDMSMPTGIKSFITSSGGTGTLNTRYFLTNDCPAGQHVLTVPSTFSFVRLADDADTDGDDCPDLKEMTGTLYGEPPASGQLRGARDPLNHFDYMDPTQDGQNRINDIVAVVQQYFEDDPIIDPGPPVIYAVDLTSKTDRAGLMPAPWNLSRPNGQQRIDDILAAVKHYFHDCPPP